MRWSRRSRIGFRRTRRTRRRKVFLVIMAVLAFIYLNNSSWIWGPSEGKPFILAHRGLGQTFPMEGITNETCTARRIYPPEHPYLENTIPSMEAAFNYGADIVELDVHITADGKFAVFHDWTLDCRTNGHGVVREHTLAELKALDIGYGYTADGGKTYPFRGKGIGLMPSLDEVLEHFPEQSFLIHVKSRDPKEGEQLAKYLATLPAERLEQLAVYGGDEPIAKLKEALPNLRVMSKKTLIKALLSYMAVGWTGYIPQAIRDTQVHIPEKFAPLLWGWPHRFLQRMNAVNTRVILVAGSGKFSEGFDSAEDLKRIPANYTGGIWTNRVDRIGPLISK